MFFCVCQVSEDQFARLFEALKSNTHLENLSLSNTGMTDKSGLLLADAITKNGSLRTVK